MQAALLQKVKTTLLIPVYMVSLERLIKLLYTCEIHCTFFQAKLKQARVLLMKMHLATVARIEESC